jgi:hypothetical protein
LESDSFGSLDRHYHHSACYSSDIGSPHTGGVTDVGQIWAENYSYGGAVRAKLCLYYRWIK